MNLNNLHWCSSFVLSVEFVSLNLQRCPQTGAHPGAELVLVRECLCRRTTLTLSAFKQFRRADDRLLSLRQDPYSQSLPLIFGGVGFKKLAFNHTALTTGALVKNIILFSSVYTKTDQHQFLRDTGHYLHSTVHTFYYYYYYYCYYYYYLSSVETL